MSYADQTIRTFLAIELTPESRKKATGIMDDLKTGARFAGSFPSWVADDNLHVTLFFLGKVSQEQVDHIGRVMTSLPKPQPFDIRMKNLGVFPNAKNPSVLWLGIDEGKKTIIKLQKAIVEKLIPLGFVTEGRPYHPHVTLARIKSRKNIKPLMDLIHSHKNADIGSMKAEKFVLMKSDLKPEGPVYSVLKEFNLQV